jgi:hypothetical protein
LHLFGLCAVNDEFILPLSATFPVVRHRSKLCLRRRPANTPRRSDYQCSFRAEFVDWLSAIFDNYVLSLRGQLIYRSANILLFTILFLWQFPHFVAIAWMYREDYARAGFEVLPRGTKRAQFVGWQSVLPTLALVFVTCVPMALRHTHPVLAFGTVFLSLGFLYFSARFALIRSNGGRLGQSEIWQIFGKMGFDDNNGSLCCSIPISTNERSWLSNSRTPWNCCPNSRR